MTWAAEGFKEAGGQPIGLQFSDKDHCPHSKIEIVPDINQRTYKLFRRADGFILVASPSSLGTAEELFRLLSGVKNKHKLTNGKPAVILNLIDGFEEILSFFLSAEDCNLIPIVYTSKAAINCLNRHY